MGLRGRYLPLLPTKLDAAPGDVTRHRHLSERRVALSDQATKRCQTRRAVCLCVRGASRSAISRPSIARTVWSRRRRSAIVRRSFADKYRPRDLAFARDDHRRIVQPQAWLLVIVRPRRQRFPVPGSRRQSGTPPRSTHPRAINRANHSRFAVYGRRTRAGTNHRNSRTPPVLRRSLEPVRPKLGQVRRSHALCSVDALIFCDWHATGVGRRMSDLALLSARRSPSGGPTVPPALAETYLNHGRVSATRCGGR